MERERGETCRSVGVIDGVGGRGGRVVEVSLCVQRERKREGERDPNKGEGGGDTRLSIGTQATH